MTQTPPSKDKVVLQLLEEGDTMLCVDARHEGVTVPREHAQNAALRLILNLNFPHPIEVTDAGVAANLSFGGRRFPCYIPMEALWAAFNPQTMQGMMWPESIPPEVQAEIAARQGQPPTDQPESQTTPRGVAGKKQHRQDKPPKERTPSRQRGHLRIVK
jgi:stringent starvation protein B